MSLSHLHNLALSKRLEFIFRTSGALNFLRASPLRRQSTEARASRLETSSSSTPALRNWTKVYPFLPAQSTLMPTSLLEHDRANFQKQQQSLIAIDEDRQVFMEQYLTHELILDKERVRSLLYLCENAINENYPTNEDIIQLCNFLKLFFTADDIYYNPKPFMIPFTVLYNRVLVLKELGFRTFSTSMIESTQDYLQMTPNNLSRFFDYMGEHNCFDSLCKTLEIVNDDKKSLMKYILQNYGEIGDVAISDLRMLCVAKYLSSLLKLGFTRVEKACSRTTRNLAELSLNTIKLNVNYLVQDFHYSSHKVIHNGLFACLNPENLQKIATKLKLVVGENTYENLVESPVILKTDYHQIVDNFSLIKSKCNGKFFTRAMELLLIEPPRLKAIFEEIEANEDLKITNLISLGYDDLAMNQSTIIARLERIKELEIPLRHVPFSFYTCSDSDFEEFINDIVTDPEMRIRIYIEEVLALDYEKVKHRLRVIPAMNAKRYSKQNAKRIIEFLISMNIPKDQIVDSLYLLLFDYKLVKSAYFNACSRYDKTLHQDPNFFKHMFDFLLYTQNKSIEN